MKWIFTVLLFLGALSVKAQFVDFGAEYSMWKGDFAVGDINGDGFYDIIFSGEEDGPWHEVGAILLNDGKGNFVPQEGDRIIKMGKSGNIQFGDIDGDGDLDVIFAGFGYPNTVGIALNDGNGVFTLANPDKYPMDLQTDAITSCGFADFNLDGLLDYYYFGNYKDGNDGRGNCFIYFQQPDGSFQASYESFNFKWIEPEVTVIDFDNNGYPDIFITCHSQEFTPNQKWSGLFKNDGFGKFNYFAGTDLGSIDPNYYQGNGTSTWGDINGDGFPDLLINGDQPNLGPGDGNVRVFKNVNGMSFQLQNTYRWYRQGSVGNGSSLVDWNNDGKLDFFIGGWNADLGRQATDFFEGTDPANFTFTKSAMGNSVLPGVSEQGFRLADLNGDNKVDLLLCGYNGNQPGNPYGVNRRITGYVLNDSPNPSVPPAAPTNLKATIDTSDGVMVTFSWTAPASEAGKQGTTYNLALKNTTTGKWFYNPMAMIGGEKNGWRKVAGRMGNVFYNKSFELYDLPEGNYEWTVQAINGAFFGGAFADTQKFTIGNPQSIKTIADYKPVVFSAGNLLKIQGANGATQSVTVYGTAGIKLVSETFVGNTEINLPTGIYIVELVKEGSVPFRTKVLVK